MADKKIGRPTESLKDTMLRVRIDKDTLEQLDECVETLDSNRSEVLRKGIKMLHDDLKNKK